MPQNDSTKVSTDDPQALRDEWINRLVELVNSIKQWAKELDWSTRQIAKKMRDSRLGPYDAPCLIIQKDTVRVLLDPVARFTPGADGVVDLYLMPAYDDIAGLYHVNGEWQLHYMFPDDPTAATIRDAQSYPLSKETLGRVLDEMTANASKSF